MKKYMILIGVLFALLVSGHPRKNPGILIADPSNPARHGKFDPLIKVPLVGLIADAVIHNGKGFVCQIDQFANDSLWLAFKTPATAPEIHFKFHWASESKATFQMLEGATWDASTGSEAPIYNRYRDSAVKSTILMDTTGAFVAQSMGIKNPDNPTGGTLIYSEKTWSDKKVGAANSSRLEMILKVNTTYILMLVSNDAAKGLQITAEYHEHTNQ